jgi:cytoskeleton protein RodZ
LGSFSSFSMDQPRAKDSNPPTAPDPAERAASPDRVERVALKDSFGEHLRREREMRGVTLEEISAATRIGTRFLDALETEHWDRLPGGVFNRGFVRSTSQFLGLDPEAMLAEYTLATADSSRKESPPVLIHSQSSWTPRPAAGPSDGRWLPWVVLIAVIAIAAGGWFGWRHYRAVRRARAAEAALEAATSGYQVATEPAAPAATAATSASTAAPDATSASQPAPDASLAPTSATPAPTSTTDSANDATSTPAVAPAPAATTGAASTSAPLVLKIEAGRATSVKVSIDGHKSFQGKIPAGGSKTFQANLVFYVTANDAGGVLLELNGQTLPPLGPPGHSASIRLTRESLTSQDGTDH